MKSPDIKVKTPKSKAITTTDNVESESNSEKRPLRRPRQRQLSQIIDNTVILEKVNNWLSCNIMFVITYINFKYYCVQTFAPHLLSQVPSSSSKPKKEKKSNAKAKGAKVISININSNIC